MQPLAIRWSVDSNGSDQFFDLQLRSRPAHLAQLRLPLITRTMNPITVIRVRVSDEHNESLEKTLSSYLLPMWSRICHGWQPGESRMIPMMMGMDFPIWTELNYPSDSLRDANSVAN